MIHKIKPPPTPKKEPLRVTSANQDRQIDMLLHRVSALTEQLSAAQNDLSMEQMHHKHARHAIVRVGELESVIVFLATSLAAAKK